MGLSYEEVYIWIKKETYPKFAFLYRATIVLTRALQLDVQGGLLSQIR